MDQIVTHIGRGGQIVIPAKYRKALGMRPGDEVIVSLEGDEVRILTPRQAVLRAQATLRKYVPPGRSLADELVAERRQEANSE